MSNRLRMQLFIISLVLMVFGLGSVLSTVPAAGAVTLGIGLLLMSGTWAVTLLSRSGRRFLNETFQKPTPPAPPARLPSFRLLMVADPDRPDDKEGARYQLDMCDEGVPLEDIIEALSTTVEEMKVLLARSNARLN